MTLGPFLGFLCYVLGTKLGGGLLFRMCFEKDVWLFVSCFGGCLIAAARQQHHTSSSSHQQQHQQQAAVGSSRQQQAAGSRRQQQAAAGSSRHQQRQFPGDLQQLRHRHPLGFTKPTGDSWPPTIEQTITITQLHLINSDN